MWLRVRTELEGVQPGEEFYLSIRLHRWTWKPVATEWPWPTLLSYRWYEKGTREEMATEAIRSLIVPAVPWGRGRDYEMRIVAPRRPGQYRLRVTLVQDRWRWLDQLKPRVFAEIPVSVESYALQSRERSDASQ